MFRFDKNDVLNRKELDITDIDIKHFKYEGRYPEDQFWDGSICYVPVIYKGQARKLRVRIKQR